MRSELLRFLLFAAIVVVCHLKTGSSKTTLDVKPFVGVATVEDALVTARLLGDKVESLNEPKPEFHPLLVFGNSNVFDVADSAKIVNAISKRARNVSRVRGVSSRLRGRGEVEEAA